MVRRYISVVSMRSLTSTFLPIGRCRLPVAAADLPPGEVAPVDGEVEDPLPFRPRPRVLALTHDVDLRWIGLATAPADRQHAPAALRAVVEIVDLEGDVAVVRVVGDHAVRKGAEDDPLIVGDHVVHREDLRPHLSGQPDPADPLRLQKPQALVDRELVDVAHGALLSAPRCARRSAPEHSVPSISPVLRRSNPRASPARANSVVRRPAATYRGTHTGKEVVQEMSSYR